MPPLADFGVGDLYSVNLSAAGSKRRAPVGDDTQIMPVLVSSLPRPPLLGLTLNQMAPLGSRVMPCAGAARPLAAATFKGLNAPVLRSNLPSVRTLFGTLQVK